jgi:hypothetical protein
MRCLGTLLPRVGPRSILVLVSIVLGAAARADVASDWDARATAVAAPAGLGEREVAIVDLAMFDAINGITRIYRPYLVQERADGPASAEAAAASAAATALAALHPQAAEDFQAALRADLARLSAAPAAIERGTRFGATVAQRLLEARAHDGATAADSYRPRTQPGRYVPTASVVAATWPAMPPFVLERPDQFRPGPPLALDSREWAEDYNEIKSLGARDSRTRTSAQTETARFWLMTGAPAYQPLARQIVSARGMSLTDGARFLALYSAALTDAYIAVFDAKYHYEFWRPITAIRNADIDGNAATDPDPSWQPLDNTPMHPEYPCAHCIQSGAAAAVIESVIGAAPLPELSLTSATLPGVTHRWSDLESFTSEVANARIWAGFHYRTSTRVGTAMGREIGRYAAMKFAPRASEAAGQAKRERR